MCKFSFFQVPNSIQLTSELRLGHTFGKRTRKETILNLPKRLRNSKGKTRVQVVYRSKNIQRSIDGNNVPYHLIPYIIGENNVQFVKITPEQYNEIMLEYKQNFLLTVLKYEMTLVVFNKKS